jgi:hypothetical protein
MALRKGRRPSYGRMRGRRLADEPRERERMRLQLAVLERKRNELVAMASAGEVEDTVMWEVQRLLDNEETRLEALLTAAEAASGGPMAAGSAVVTRPRRAPSPPALSRLSPHAYSRTKHGRHSGETDSCECLPHDGEENGPLPGRPATARHGLGSRQKPLRLCAAA